MKNPTTFTVAMLKEKLKSLNMLTYRSKSELNLRLSKMDPSGSWMEALNPENPENDTDKDEAGAVTTDEEIEEQRQRFNRVTLYQKKVDFVMRENKLIKREIGIMRRENKLLRSMRSVPVAETQAAV